MFTYKDVEPLSKEEMETLVKLLTRYALHSYPFDSGSSEECDCWSTVSDVSLSYQLNGRQLTMEESDPEWMEDMIIEGNDILNQIDLPEGLTF